MKISQIDAGYKTQGNDVIRFIFGDKVNGSNSSLSSHFSLLKGSTIGTIGFCDVVLKKFQIPKKFPCDTYNPDDYEMKDSFCILLIAIEPEFRSLKSTKQILDFLEQKAYSMNFKYLVGLNIQNDKIINVANRIGYKLFMENNHCVKIFD